MFSQRLLQPPDLVQHHDYLLLFVEDLNLRVYHVVALESVVADGRLSHVRVSGSVGVGIRDSRRADDERALSTRASSLWLVFRYADQEVSQVQEVGWFLSLG